MVKIIINVVFSNHLRVTDFKVVDAIKMDSYLKMVSLYSGDMEQNSMDVVGIIVTRFIQIKIETLRILILNVDYSEIMIS